MSETFDWNEAPAPAAAIAVEGLTFSYPQAKVPVLRDLNWKVPRGAFAILVGGTGSGKSTLLSLLKPQIAPAGTARARLRWAALTLTGSTMHRARGA